jgi:hypothetical protein
MLAAAGMLTAASDFHHLGSLGFTTVLAAIFAVFLCPAIARTMRTLSSIFFSHNPTSSGFQRGIGFRENVL